MPYIPLTQGQKALVDPEDYAWLSQYKWYAHKTTYGTYMAARTYRDETGKLIFLYMHRAIVAAPEGMVVDHINGDTLDNRRANLRICTRAENNRNMHRFRTRKRAAIHSRFKGVYWDKKSKKWMAQIRVNKRNIYLGRYETEQEAAIAYDLAALHYFGDYARPNFVEIRKDVQECQIKNPAIATRSNLSPSFLEQSGSLLEVQTF